jgi:hypothetical protein
LRRAKAKALDAGQDVVGGLGPAERFGIGVGSVDVSLDRLLFGDRVEYASFQSALG